MQRRRIAIVGCGQMGSRHLQAIVKLGGQLDIQVVERNLANQELAKKFSLGMPSRQALSKRGTIISTLLKRGRANSTKHIGQITLRYVPCFVSPQEKIKAFPKDVPKKLLKPFMS